MGLFIITVRLHLFGKRILLFDNRFKVETYDNVASWLSVFSTEKSKNNTFKTLNTQKLSNDKKYDYIEIENEFNSLMMTIRYFDN